MDRLVELCAGLDVNRDTVVGCVQVPGKGPRRPGCPHQDLRHKLRAAATHPGNS